MTFSIGDRVEWVHEVPGSGRRPRRAACTPGRVVALDLPGQPPGVEVKFDATDPDTGAPGCYAAYGEIRRAP